MSSIRTQPLHRYRQRTADPRLVRILSAEDRGDGTDAVGGDRAAGAAAAEFRLGHLRRRRLDPRAHARDRQAHPRRDDADAGRASDLRRRDPRGGRRGDRRLRAGRRAPYRGAARRSGRRRRRALMRRIPAAIATPPISSPASSASPISKCRSRPIRKSIRTAPTSPPTSTCSRPRSMPARAAPSPSSFSRTSLYFRYLDRVRASGIDIPIVPGILPVQNFKQTKNFAARTGASVPDWLARPLRRPRRRSGDAQADRRRGRRRAGARSGRPRRDRFPLLHHEPRRPRLRDLPPAGTAARRREQARAQLVRRD